MTSTHRVPSSRISSAVRAIWPLRDGLDRDTRPKLEPDAAAAAEDYRRLRDAQRISRVGSWRHDAVTREIAVSETLLELYGLDPTKPVTSYERLNALTHADDRFILYAATDRMLDTGEMIDVRFRVLRGHDGELRWFHARGEAERDDEGGLVSISGTVADVTELVAAEIESRRAHQELSVAHGYQQAVIAATPDAIHVYDTSRRDLRRADHVGKPLTGFATEAVSVMAGRGVHQYVSLADQKRLSAFFLAGEQLPDTEVADLRHAVLLHDGGVCWLSRRITPFMRDSAGEVTALLVVSRDVTDVVVAERQLKHAATHDELTGLANRRLFSQQLQDRTATAGPGGPTAVLICDIDGFKRINDSYGHRAGDEVLIEVGHRLRAVTRAEDTVARLGGDEFAIILAMPPDTDPQDQAVEVARRISEALQTPVHAAGLEHSITMSIGIRVARTQFGADELLSDADAAMYFVKKHGANGHTFFDPSHRPDTAHHDHLERLIRRALAEGLVHVHYQPIVDSRGGCLHAVEALMRIWDDETGRYANTADIVAVAERTGQVAALDQIVLEIATTRAAEWRRSPDLANLVLKVNRSAKEISRPGLFDRVVTVLATSGLDASALTLELTETVLLDMNADTLTELRRLRDLGIGLAIDDFGTGYASLRYLADLPVTCIKIDRSFTMRLPNHTTSMTLVRATVGLAEQLGLSCIVEGVETLDQLNALPTDRQLFVQGYLFSKPQPFPDAPPARYVAEKTCSVPLELVQR